MKLRAIIAGISLAVSLSAADQPIPLNTAESVLCAFWDEGLSDLPLWQLEGEEVSARQTWCNVELSWKNRFRLTRKLDLDCSRFDQLILGPSLIAGTRVTLEAESDRGPLRAEFTVSGDRRNTELVLPLAGARRLSRLTIGLESSGKSSGILKYLILADSGRLKEIEKQYEELGKIDFSRFIRLDAVPAGMPGLKIFCDESRVEQVRKMLDSSPELAARLRKEADRLKKNPPPEQSLRAYPLTDRRFARDRDYDRPDLYGNVDCVWLGVLLRDRELLRLAARRAISLILTQEWGAGMMASLPGTTFEHRCFSECEAMESLAFTLDFCYDLFTPHGRNLILRALGERGTATTNYVAWKWDYIYYNNQLPAFSYARIAAYAAMEKSGWKHVEPYTDQAIRELDQAMNHIFPADGGFHEGPGYFQYTLSNAIPSYYLYARLRGKKFNDILPECLRNVPDYAELVMSTVPGQGFLPVNDSGSDITSPGIFLLAGIFPGTSFSELAGQVLETPARRTDAVRHGYFADAPQPLAFRPRNFLKIDSINAASSFRTWNGKVLKIVVFADAARTGHKHADAGQFLIEFDGETFAADSSTCNYASPMAKVLQSAPRHNVFVPVDAKGEFVEPALYASGVKFEASGDGKRFHAVMDLLPFWKGKFLERRRELRSDSPDRLMLTDHYRTADSASGGVFFWLTPLPISIEGRQVTITGKKNTMQFTIPAGWTAEQEKLYYSTLNRLTLKSPSSAGTLRLDIRFAAK